MAKGYVNCEQKHFLPGTSEILISYKKETP